MRWDALSVELFLLLCVAAIIIIFIAVDVGIDWFLQRRYRKHHLAVLKSSPWQIPDDIGRRYVPYGWMDEPPRQRPYMAVYRGEGADPRTRRVLVKKMGATRVTDVTIVRDEGRSLTTPPSTPPAGGAGEGT